MASGFPSNAWGIMDLIYGLFIGSFGVLVTRARDYDCFSYFFNLAISIGAYGKYYDEEFTGTTSNWLGIVFKLPSDVLAIYSTSNRCF